VSTSKLNLDMLQDEAAARNALEAIRWPHGPVCHHCGSPKHYATKRVGGYRCASPTCRKDFTVMTGTVMERSHIPLHKWLQGWYLLCSSKKGISTKQVERTLGLTYKASWFLMHRIREAMREGGLVPPTPLGGGGRTVEADETYYGKAETRRPRNKYLSPPTKGGNVGPAGKRPILSLVERGGRVRSFHVPVADKVNVTAIVRENIARESMLHTDESQLYTGSDTHFAGHESVKHSIKEYVRGEVHTNTVEGYFSISKRGMRGIYQHCKEKHLHRYLAEYDFRYNHREKLGFNDLERTARAIAGAEGKRLTYRQPH
jgi:transposase-like protein